MKKYLEFVNESIRDKMTPKSLDEIKKKVKSNLDSMNVTDKLYYISSNNLPNEVIEEYKDELMDYVKIQDMIRVEALRRQHKLDKLDKNKIESEIMNAVWDDDLNDAVMSVQNLIGQKYGDRAGIFFSYDDVEGDWERKSELSRRIKLNQYLYDEFMEVDNDNILED